MPGVSAPEHPGAAFVSAGRALVELAQLLGAALEAWAPLFRELAESAERLARRLGPYTEALREAAQRPDARRQLAGLAALATALDSAPAYCVPYDCELVRLGLAPLTVEEQRNFAVVAALLASRREQLLGQRVPLEQVALAAGRADVAAAVVMERGATRRAIRFLEIENKREEGELVSAAYGELREKILPSIERRVRRIRMADSRRLGRPMLEQMVRDAYLGKSIRRALVQQLEREGKQAEREATFSSAMAKRLAEAELRPDWELGWDIEQATASFLQRPRASELDRKLVAALRRWPDCSTAEIARRIGEPIRTVQYHWRKLLEHVRKQLEI
jgi:hypothetical protein